jgi:hypothetical protein
MKIKELFESTSEENKRIHDIIRGWRQQLKNERWSKEAFGTYEITPNGIDHKGKHLNICHFMLDENGELPIKFWRCNAITIYLQDPNQLKSFKNFPEIISRQNPINSLDSALEANHDINIDSLEGIPRIMGGGRFSLTHFPKLSLHNIHKHIDRADEIYLGTSYKGPLLSILKMKYQDKSHTIRGGTIGSPLEQATKIINKHMATGKNIIACQKELYDNDLDEYAEL